MRYVFISKHGDIHPIAKRIENEDNDVSMFVCKDEDLLVDKHITSINPDIIVIDSYGFGSISSRLRNKGFSVVGGSRLTDQLDSDDTVSEKVLKMCGLSTSGNNGVNVRIDGWFNGTCFINHLYSVDDIITSGLAQDKLYKEGLIRLSAALAKAGYVGPASITAVVTKDSVWYKDLRARFSANTMLMFKEGLKGKLSNVFIALSQGQKRMFMFKPGYFTLVQISVHPNTLFDGSQYHDIIAPNIPEETVKHLWLFGFVKKQENMYSYRGHGGRIAVATARGDTIREARRRVYRTVFNLQIPNILFLKDVGKSALVGYSNIKQWGWVL